MKVLFAINEAFPLYKIGGLGDVGGSLPQHLITLGCDIRLILPKHPEIILDDSWHSIEHFSIIYDQKKLQVTIYMGYLPGTNIPTYLISEDNYLSQSTDASDNHADKYAVFSLACAKFIAQQSPHWQPRIIHSNDWHTALIPVFLKHIYQNQSIKNILTIHNLSYQGITTTPIITKAGMKNADCRIVDWDMTDSNLNILMEGLLHSDHITTVSPSYAKEILTHQYGEKLEPILQTINSKLTGIINGLDTHTFNPNTDPYIDPNYSIENAIEQKQQNKIHLFKYLGIKAHPQSILIGFVGRVDPKQKGIDLIISALRDKLLPPENAYFIFLGTGEPNMETKLHQHHNSQNSTIITRYDEALAQKIYAASELMLIPSLFEPCGLVQLIAMRYGALPIARNTGGLKDTIKHETDGFLFDNYSTKDMIQCLCKSIDQINNADKQAKMVKNAMTKDVSWQIPAKQYKKLYQTLITT